MHLALRLTWTLRLALLCDKWLPLGVKREEEEAMADRRVFRITYKTACGRTDVAIETGATLEDALMKAKLNVEAKHFSMEVVKVECREHGRYSWTKVK